MHQDEFKESNNYAYGGSISIEEERLPPGINEDVVRAISKKRNEPDWLLGKRLSALKTWQSMQEPNWANLHMPDMDLQKISFFSKPVKKSKEDIDPAVYEEFEKLGIPLKEQDWLAGVAVDAVFDSESVLTTHKEKLAEVGVIFCSISDAIRDHPELVQLYLGSVVPEDDNYWSGLNSAVFSDGSFVYIPPGLTCPMELSTYFRMNAIGTGQFERTLIIADKGSKVSYIEGCTAPRRDDNQLHAAIVELIALDDAEIKYSTVQNWYPGDENGVGGIFNLVTKRGRCIGKNSKIIWTQVETGSAVTWKYPSVILEGEGSVGEFYSVAITRDRQQADTGTKMIHIGKNTKSVIVSKGISSGNSSNTYRGNVWIGPKATGSRNTTQCDSLLLGNGNNSKTVPVVSCQNTESVVEHEASTGRISDLQLWYMGLRGYNQEQASRMLVGGFCRDIFKKLPMEFAVEADMLLSVKLEGAIG
jgi:Fe-S cluster assembly protein SufB